jgi:hypothetical protein
MQKTTHRNANSRRVMYDVLLSGIYVYNDMLRYADLLQIHSRCILPSNNDT